MSKIRQNEDWLEARVGFEPTNGGFADLSLGPLGYRARARQYIEKRLSMSVALAEYEDIIRPAKLDSCH